MPSEIIKCKCGGYLCRSEDLIEKESIVCHRCGEIIDIIPPNYDKTPEDEFSEEWNEGIEIQQSL